MREQGASYEAIADHFGVVRTRVMYALDPDFAARERARAKKNFHGRRRGYKVTGAMTRRMVELAEAGLSYEDIAKALTVYHGRSLTGGTVKNHLRRMGVHVERKPRGCAFGSPADPRGVAA